MNEKAQYLESISDKSQNGLKDVKFFKGNVFEASEEAAYGELNRLHSASDLPDKEVLGKYSPALL